MNFVISEGSGHDAFDFDEEHVEKRNAAQEQHHIFATNSSPTRKQYLRREGEHPPTVDDISSFLETMHSKNLTLKKLAKVQQRRIDELTQENIALRQASEMKDEEIRKANEHLSLLRDATGDADLSEIVPRMNSDWPLNTGSFSKVEQSDASKASSPPSGSSRRSKKTSGERRKTSIIVSHKVAVKRVMHLMRKINGVCNRRSVGLYTLACYLAKAVLLGFSAEVSPTLCVPPA